MTSELPPGLPMPTELAVKDPARVGGYTTILWILGIVWVLGLAVLIFWKTKSPETPATQAAHPSLPDRLRDLLDGAAKGTLDDDQKASLERLILGFWHQRLPDLAHMPPAEALATLRQHGEAGPLLLQLEEWLHRRDAAVSPERINELLEPYH